MLGAAINFAERREAIHTRRQASHERMSLRDYPRNDSRRDCNAMQLAAFPFVLAWCAGAYLCGLLRSAFRP